MLRVLIAEGKYFPRRVGLHTRWECFRHLRAALERLAIDGLEPARVVEVHDGIELPRQAGFKVVTLALRLRSVDDANRAFESSRLQRFCNFIRAERQKEPG